ncbi:MAG: hypothetical protein ACPHP2_05725 [Limisphaerales bacterium]
MLVRVADEPGGIAHLAERLRDGNWDAIAVSAAPIEKARDLVKDELLSIAPAV